MKKFKLIAAFILFSVSGFAQIREKFQEQLKEDSAKAVFAKKVVQLNNLFKNETSFGKVDSLREKGEYDFLDKRILDQRTIIVFDLSSALKDKYNELEQGGKIERLRTLRKKGRLKIIARGIASEVELPKKTNTKQSYNEFYLHVIRDLLQRNKSLLQADKLDFEKYQLWEKEEKLTTSFAIREYRASFIRFLYKHYNLN